MKTLRDYINLIEANQQGVAEAHDPNFTGFMNRALGTRQDKKPLRVDPKTVMSMNNMPGYKHAFKFGMDIIKKMDPDTKEHFANEDDNALESYMIDIAEKKGFIPKYFVEEDLSEVVGEFEEIFHDPEMEGWSWADLLRDMIGQEPKAHEKANVQAHKQMMAKSQVAKDKPESIDPNKLQVVDRTDTGKSEIWYPHGDFFGTSSWAVVQDGFKDKAHAEHALKQLKANPNVVNIIKKAIADEGLAEGFAEGNEAYVACIVDFNRSGQAMVRRSKPVNKAKAEEIIANAKAKNTFVHPPFMTIYPASAGKLDGETIMKQFPDMSQQGVAEGLTPSTIHKLADRKGIKWDNEPSFLKLTKRLTGKEHLDDLDQTGLQKVKQHLEKQGVAEGDK